MTPDWLVKLGIEKINAKKHGPDVSWLIEELSARLNLESKPSISLPKIYQEGMDNIYCKQCKEKILPGQYFDFDSLGYSHHQLKDCYKYKRLLQTNPQLNDSRQEESPSIYKCNICGFIGRYSQFVGHIHLEANDKTTEREVTRENTLDGSGDFNQTQQKA